jgi:uncharacterized protein (DUF433 family)
MDTLLDRITVVEGLRGGKPTIRGMRITVQEILEHLSAGDTMEDVIQAFPFLTKEDIQAALLYASQLAGGELTLRKVA